jgi:hypothetical protein
VCLLDLAVNLIDEGVASALVLHRNVVRLLCNMVESSPRLSHLLFVVLLSGDHGTSPSSAFARSLLLVQTSNQLSPAVARLFAQLAHSMHCGSSPSTLARVAACFSLMLRTPDLQASDLTDVPSELTTRYNLVNALATLVASGCLAALIQQVNADDTSCGELKEDGAEVSTAPSGEAFWGLLNEQDEHGKELISLSAHDVDLCVQYAGELFAIIPHSLSTLLVWQRVVNVLGDYFVHDTLPLASSYRLHEYLIRVIRVLEHIPAEVSSRLQVRTSVVRLITNVLMRDEALGTLLCTPDAHASLNAPIVSLFGCLKISTAEPTLQQWALVMVKQLINTNHDAMSQLMKSASQPFPVP